MENDYSEIRRQLTKYNNVQSLMRYINEKSLKEKNKEINGNKATGIDRVTKELYNTKLDENISRLVEEMKEMKYKPLPVRRVYTKSKWKGKRIGYTWL